MPLPRLRPLPRPQLLGPSRRARWRRWALRRVAAAGCAAAAVVVLVGVVRPPPAPTTPVVVAEHDLTSGAVLTEADLSVVRLPRDPPSVASVAEPRLLVGRRLSTRVLSGEVLTTSRLAPRTAAEGLPPGTVAAHLLVADERTLDIVAPGLRVTLFADVGGPALAEDVLVLAVDTPEAGGLAGSLSGGAASPRGLVCALGASDLTRVFAGERPDGGAPRVLPVVTG